MTRAQQVLRFTRDRGEVTTGDVVRLLKTHVHDAARLLYKLRAEGLLEPSGRPAGPYGRMCCELTEQGHQALCERIDTAPPIADFDFWPLMSAIGHLNVSSNPRSTLR